MVQPGGNADSKPAVFNSNSTGASSSNTGQLEDLQSTASSRPVNSQLTEGGQASDTGADASRQSTSVASDNEIYIGKVVCALPYIHSYTVQLSNRKAPLICVACESSTTTFPLGVRSSGTVPVNSQVVVWCPAASTFGYIIAIAPEATLTDTLNSSDTVQAGGNSGIKKKEPYRDIPASSGKTAASMVPHSGSRPIDATQHEYVRMSETGIGILIDSFQAYLRVNESCGLFLNYFDNYAKLTGTCLHLSSYCENNMQLYDEGELHAFKGHATYPWEAAGLYDDGSDFTETNGAEDVQLNKEFPFASTDLADPAIEPVFRLTEYSGYIGQGYNRTLMKPAKESGKRLMTDNDKDTGLFQELIALDGSYSVRSAKQVNIVKYPLIPVPRRSRMPEDGKGDDLTEDPNYKFSGKFGSGPDHKVKDWDDADVSSLKSLLKPAGVQDLLTHHYNWKSTHPFAYHEKDYEYPEEDQGDDLNEVKFYRGTRSRAYVDISASEQLTIDERYGPVNYYNTASFFSLLDDGSVVIGDGYGSQITLTGGQIRLEAGGDVMLMSGSRVVTLADEAIVRAHGSVDISSSKKDVRIKAENNLQMLAANSGNGSLLIESKSTGGIRQGYDKSLGESVSGSGIILLAKGGAVSTLASDVYLRSGVEAGNAEGGRGDIVLDAANGNGQISQYAAYMTNFCSTAFAIVHSPEGQDGALEKIKPEKSHIFTPQASKIQGPLVINGNLAACEGGGFFADGTIYSNKSVYALGQMACYKAKVQDSSEDPFPTQVRAANEAYCDFGETVISGFSDLLFLSIFPERWWSPDAPGNTEFIDNQVGFSFRDDSSSGDTVYGYSEFYLLEARWQQLGRMGLVNEGTTWKENPVKYQSKDLYPWPGEKNWKTDQKFYQYGSDNKFELFDSGGFAKSRETDRDKYENPKFPAWKEGTCDTDYKL